jgi:hypothetical protein
MESTPTEAQAKLEHLQELRKMWLDEAVKKGGVIDKAICVAKVFGVERKEYPNTYVYNDCARLAQPHIYYSNNSPIQFCKLEQVYITYNHKTVVDYTDTDIPDRLYLNDKSFVVLHGEWINEINTLFSVAQNIINKNSDSLIIDKIKVLSELLLVDENGNPIDEVLNG